jgi:ribonuclease J
MAETSKPVPGEELIFLPLGGIGEIGMNCYLYGVGPEDRRTWLMVDLGITFPEGEFDPGVDVILPDVRFIAEERASLAGIVLTHAHEDHFGAVAELWPRLRAPLYATPFTAALLKAKLAEYGAAKDIEIHEIPLNSRFTVGPFDLELVTVAHSIPEPNALVLRTPFGNVLHTGDWKIDDTPFVGDPIDKPRLKALGEEGILAMVSDSTNAMRDGRSPSESEVAENLKAIIRRAKRRVAVTIFASNVSRIKAVAEAARAAGRQIVVAGRAMHRMIQVAKETGYLPADFRYHDQQHFTYVAPEEVVVLCTGSQGEPRAALARVAEDQHPDIRLEHGDLVIFSSRTIPGNERVVGRIQNRLVEMGCELVTDNESLVHVTGHPRRDEMRELYGWVKPRIAIPMHGEARHLAEHAKLAKAAGVPEVLTIRNGDIVRLAPGPAEIVDEAPVGRLFRDGELITESDAGAVRERRALSFAGIVVVAFAVSQKGDIGHPEILLDGVPHENDAGRPMLSIVADAVENTIRSIPPKNRRDVETIREAVRRSVRAAVENHWGKRPITKVLVTRLPR